MIAIAAISASAAAAAPVAGTATLAAPAAAERVTTARGLWQCTGTSCAGTADSVVNTAVGLCTTLADRAGRVSAFSAGDAAFGEAELARCNRHLKS
ncbi:CC_3452 family protein [Polymorphobacter fuscus]|uniref:Uncharacterized protein n=1 Tax=Sandarakinorhabdus fusca TaxID=1439888 RepID=A0A7C9KGG2_9SPHN|nr:hypothetical protein [Polymorphobacter fuscus]KAB7648525.1 hypothetical protein F9290_02130 [Polymorphobacter fuscus]MQT16060.1 hypothetical protein [Polymorphobacter fuscus]NJC07662.1 hypothetical protein [Polymorphobacter fuscus]